GEVVFFTFIIGGMFMVLRRTGIIEVVVDILARKFSNRSILVIPVLMTVFAVIATLIGTAELSLVYIPVIMPLMIALGYDSITAAATALVGTVVGFTAGVLNPINTVLGQKLSDVPVFSVLVLRFLIFVFDLTECIMLVMRYAKKVQNNPLISNVYEDDTKKRSQYKAICKTDKLHMNIRQVWASIATLFFFGIL